MIIGIIDSGIWPEHASFADRIDTTTNTPSHTGDQQVYDAPPSSWKGDCVEGEGFSKTNCNNKLIGARFFKDATQTFHWTEFNSARVFDINARALLRRPALESDADVVAEHPHGRRLRRAGGGRAEIVCGLHNWPE